MELFTPIPNPEPDQIQLVADQVGCSWRTAYRALEAMRDPTKFKTLAKDTKKKAKLTKKGVKTDTKVVSKPKPMPKKTVKKSKPKPNPKLVKKKIDTKPDNKVVKKSDKPEKLTVDVEFEVPEQFKEMVACAQYIEQRLEKASFNDTIRLYEKTQMLENEQKDFADNQVLLGTFEDLIRDYVDLFKEPVDPNLMLYGNPMEEEP